MQHDDDYADAHPATPLFKKTAFNSNRYNQIVHKTENNIPEDIVPNVANYSSMNKVKNSLWGPSETILTKGDA